MKTHPSSASFSPRRLSPLSCVNGYLAIDSGWNGSDLVFAHNCCVARMLPEEAELVSDWTDLPGRFAGWKCCLSWSWQSIIRVRARLFRNVPTWTRDWFPKCSNSSAWLVFECSVLQLGRVQLILNIPLLLLALYSRMQLWRQSLCHGLIARMEPTLYFEN